MENEKISSGKVLSGLIWKFAEAAGAQFVSSITTIVIARILDPDAYGIVAIISVFIAIFSVFVDSGLGSALVQKKEPDDLDYSTVFFASTAVCCLVYLILFISAPYISKFFEIESMTKLLRVAGLTILISAVKNVQGSYISKHMMFKKFFFASLGGTIVAGIVGIVLALNGFGVWALIISTLTDNIIDTLVMWLSIDWRPKLIFSFERLKTLFGYGSKLLISNILNKVYDNLYQLVIGKMYSTEQLAYYNKGDNLPNKITTNINNSINGVLMPVMANAQDDKQQVKLIMKRMLQASFYIMTPLLVGLAVVARPAIIVVLGEKWLPVVPFMQIMCLIKLFRPIHTANLIAIQSQGRSDIFLIQEIIKKVTCLAVLFIVYRYGVLAMAFGMLISDGIDQFTNSIPNIKLLNYSLLEQYKDILPILVLGTCMGILVYSCSFINISNQFILLVILVIIGGVFYISMSYLFKLESFYYVLGMVKDLLNRRKAKDE